MATKDAVEVFVLPTGYLSLPDHWIFADGDENITHFSPDHSFLIRHPSGRNVLFDLGMRKDLDSFPRRVREEFDSLQPYVPKDSYDILLEGPTRPGDIDTIIMSHMHFDHTGDPTKFPGAKILLGPGSRAAASPGYPVKDDSPFDGVVFRHGNVQELAQERYEPLDKKNLPGGFPFDRGVDLFGDGTLLLLDAPGHMKGHQIALARTGPQEWVTMGGDCCHHRDLLEDESRDIGVKTGPGGRAGFHSFHDDARSTIAKLRQLHCSPEVFVLLPHDAKVDGCIPMYPENVNGWREKNLKNTTRDRPLTLDDVKA